MKKWLAALMVILCMGTTATAEEATKIEFGQVYHTDLDGNGTVECWGWSEAENDEGDAVRRLTVTSQDGAGESATWEMDAYWTRGADYYLIDLDGSGVMEQFVSSDTGENYSYTTWCLRYRCGEIEEVMFSQDPWNWKFTSGFSGLITQIGSGTVTMQRYTNVLGTWRGSWSYEIGEKGRLTALDDGWCTRDFSYWGGSVENAWEDAALTVMVETAYRDGDRVGMLKPGDRILITGTDHDNYVSFLTKDGQSGMLYVEKKGEMEFGWNVNQNTREELEESGGILINLIDEDEFFKGLPYAG